MSSKTAFLALILALVSLAALNVRSLGIGGVGGNETAYERVLRTGTLRCGYVTYPPNMIKNPKTGVMSGIDYEISQAIGRKLNLKIEWAEEAGWGSMVPALKSAKFDAVCNGDWVSPAIAREAFFSRPYYYQPLFIASRPTDNRFDGSVENLNASGVTIASMDGDNPRFIAEQDFPQAKIFTVPDRGGEQAVLESVASGRADATFIDAAGFGDYNARNPGKLKLVQSSNPVRVYPVAFVLPLGDEKLRAMINAAFDELIYSGQVEKILKRYETYPNSFVFVDRPHAKETAAAVQVAQP